MRSCKGRTEKRPLIAIVGSVVTLAKSWTPYRNPSGFPRVILQLWTVPGTQ